MIFLAGVTWTTATAGAQNVPAMPALQRRSAEIDAPPDLKAFAPGSTSLPDEVFGAYALGDAGEVIQLIAEREGRKSRLTGYLSQSGDGESDKGTPLTYFFARSTLSGRQLTFATKQVHGVWYGFEGTIVPVLRQPGSPQPDSSQHASRGAYLLEGTLITHMGAQGVEQPRRVSLPLLADQVDDQ